MHFSNALGALLRNLEVSQLTSGRFLIHMYIHLRICRTCVATHIYMQVTHSMSIVAGSGLHTVFSNRYVGPSKLEGFGLKLLLAVTSHPQQPVCVIRVFTDAHIWRLYALLGDEVHAYLAIWVLRNCQLCKQQEIAHFAARKPTQHVTCQPITMATCFLQQIQIVE